MIHVPGAEETGGSQCHYLFLSSRGSNFLLVWLCERPNCLTLRETELCVRLIRSVRAVLPIPLVAASHGHVTSTLLVSQKQQQFVKWSDGCLMFSKPRWFSASEIEKGPSCIAQWASGNVATLLGVCRKLIEWLVKSVLTLLLYCFAVLYS